VQEIRRPLAGRQENFPPPATSEGPLRLHPRHAIEQAPRQLDIRPDLGAPLARALAAPCPSAEAALAAISSNDPAAHLLTIVAACYYTDDEVKRRIGYEGQIAKPFAPDRFPSYIAEGLLDHLVADA